MSYDIIIRFPSESIAKEFCAQMSDGFGEGVCDFSFWLEEDGEHKKITDNGKDVYFVNSVFFD